MAEAENQSPREVIADGAAAPVQEASSRARDLLLGKAKQAVRDNSGLRREFVFEAGSLDKAARTVALSFSSECPVKRQDYAGRDFWEVLDHAHVNMERMRAGAPLLYGHDRRDHLGTVKEAIISQDRRGRAVVKFSRSAFAQEKFQDVEDGILTSTSVGYDLDDADYVVEGEREGIPVYRFRNWTPFEVTLTPVPADPSVGVDRSATDKTENKQSARAVVPVIQKMDTNTPAAPAATAPTPAVEVRSNQIPESTRMSEIRAIGEKFNIPQERVIKALAENESLESFRTFVVTEHLKAKPVTVPPTIGMSRDDKRRYSMARAINRLSNFQPLDGLEKECSDEAAKKQNRAAPAMGFVVPQDMGDFADPEMVRALLRVSPALARSPYGQQLSRAMSAGVFNAGGSTVATELLGGSMIELLRNKMLITQLGVGTLSGLVGNIAIPRQTGGATAYWLSEGENVTASQQTLVQVAATPRKLAAQTAYTKQFLAQSSIDGEAFVRDDLMKVLAIAKDLAAINGTGGKQPLGILNGPTGGSENQMNTVAFGAAPTWAKVVEFESAIQSANADLGTMQFLTNPTVRAKWKTTAKVSNYPVFLCGDDNSANGYPVNVTNQIATVTNKVIFGAWGQAMYCDWAGQDVVVDPYTQAAAGNVVITISMWTDFIVRHWPSFAISTDSGAQ